ncbi:hypothetical protein GLOIN_2v1677683 [Rhizophagus irregularis DAOM 181602=DAOM 197198]|nr:hypothetical protein GLOIN_2v1677683 [Rhizophagus irregularis DAOM 181602=DAOM 197198]
MNALMKSRVHSIQECISKETSTPFMEARTSEEETSKNQYIKIFAGLSIYVFITECRTIRKHFSRTRNMFDACVQPGTTIIEVGPYTFYSAHTMFFRYTKHQNLFFLRRSFHSSVISKNDMLQL